MSAGTTKPNRPVQLATARQFGLTSSVLLSRYLAILVTLGLSGYFAYLALGTLLDVAGTVSDRDDLKPFRGTRAFCCALLCLLSTSRAVAQPRAETVAAFDRYMAAAQSRIQSEQSSPDKFLRIDSLSSAQHVEVEARLRRGEVVIDKAGETPQEIPGGLVHDWIGTAFIPGVTVAQVLSVVQDYDHLTRYYQPDVEASRLISRDGNDFRIFMRLRKHKVITVVLDTDYDVHYARLDANHWYSDSVSTRVVEQDGGDHGFLWRLNSYWRFVQVSDGVFIQCEAISLTRDIPSGLGWMIGPFVTSIPRESLEFTLSATRNAVKANQSVFSGRPNRTEDGLTDRKTDRRDYRRDYEHHGSNGIQTSSEDSRLHYGDRREKDPNLAR